MSKNNDTKQFRPAAIPLMTIDPFFSVWSASDKLYGDYTRHWSGRLNPMFCGVNVDGIYYAAMGIARSLNSQKSRNTQHLEQVSVEITPLKTKYRFRNEKVELLLTFISPLLPNRLDILSRTASYVEYEMINISSDVKEIEFVFGISAECCVDSWEQNVKFGRTEQSTFVGNVVQPVLQKSGDITCIDWGYLHIADTTAKIVKDIKVRHLDCLLYDEIDINTICNAMGEHPYMLLEKAEKSGVITIAYDEVYPIEYFHEPLEEYYKKFYSDFAEMLRVAIDEYNVVKELCENFDRQYISEAIKFGEKYMLITSLAYRQVLAAHKLVEDKKGNLIYLSKECDSNGCIGTLDVTYPSIPLFLKYNPELVLGMLRPIIHYANTTEWEYEFAPHDVGRYPLANGQVYGNNELKYQMPIEECGNMLLCVAAVAKATGNIEFAIENQEILKKWAEYLIQKGYNPEDQLCTDDFAGHLAQNCNLSLKSILGIAAYGKLFGEDSYIAIAKKMADKWCEEAVSIDSTHTKLAFDQNDTWSLKYNIVWDKLLDIGLFEEKIFANEVAWYKQKMNHYGVPLDSRKDYTKLDWLFWTTVMTSDKEYFTGVVDAVFDMICDTEDRVPMTDYYDTSDAHQRIFQARSVLGGIFINFLVTIQDTP